MDTKDKTCWHTVTKLFKVVRYVWSGGVITSIWGSQKEKHDRSDWSEHRWCRVMHSCFPFLTESQSNKVALKTPEYSLKMNNMSLLNFDSLSCWVVIVLPRLEYDYIRPLILTSLRFLFRHTAGEEEMKWGNAKPQEKTLPGAPFLPFALRSVKAWHQNKSGRDNVLQPSAGQKW